MLAGRLLTLWRPVCLPTKRGKSPRTHLLFATEEFCKRKAFSKMIDIWQARPDVCSISVLNDYHTSISNHNFKRGKHEVSAAIPREFLQKQFHHHKAIAQSSLCLFFFVLGIELSSQKVFLWNLFSLFSLCVFFFLFKLSVELIIMMSSS